MPDHAPLAIIPVILCGGAGSRLWPLSRSARPKQFLRFEGKSSLLQDTLRRCNGPLFDPLPILVANESHANLLRHELLDSGLKGQLLLEPMRRDSCAAIVAGALAAVERNEEAMILVLAADHAVPDAEAFGQAVLQGLAAAHAGYLLTFGIKPTHPATAYGYIRAEPTELTKGTHRVAQFVEKPDAVRAAQYIKDGLLWNSGNFLFKAKIFLEEVGKFALDVLEPVSRAVHGGRKSQDATYLESLAFAEARSISVDFAVMERTHRAAVCPVSYSWSDIGSWDAVNQFMAQTEAGNSSSGHVTFHRAHNNMVIAEGKTTAVIGVNDLIIVATPDALLVADKAAAQDVKLVIDALKKQGVAAAEHSRTTLTPWGETEIVYHDAHVTVSKHLIAPGALFPLGHKDLGLTLILTAGTLQEGTSAHAHRYSAGDEIKQPDGLEMGLSNFGSGFAVVMETLCLTEHP